MELNYNLIAEILAADGNEMTHESTDSDNEMNMVYGDATNISVQQQQQQLQLQDKTPNNALPVSLNSSFEPQGIYTC